MSLSPLWGGWGQTIQPLIVRTDRESETHRQKKGSTSGFLQLFLLNELSLFSEAMAELKENTALFGCIIPASLLKNSHIL